VGSKPDSLTRGGLSIRQHQTEQDERKEQARTPLKARLDIQSISPRNTVSQMLLGRIQNVACGLNMTRRYTMSHSWMQKWPSDLKGKKCGSDRIRDSPASCNPHSKTWRVQFKEHVYVDVHNLYRIHKGKCVCVCMFKINSLTP
jgi:hypothetical protein